MAPFENLWWLPLFYKRHLFAVHHLKLTTYYLSLTTYNIHNFRYLVNRIFHTSPLTSRKFSRYNIHRDSISDAVFCGYGGIGRRARFRFWWETVQVQVLLTALLKSPVFTCFPVNTGLFYIKILFWHNNFFFNSPDKLFLASLQKSKLHFTCP